MKIVELKELLEFYPDDAEVEFRYKDRTLFGCTDEVDISIDG